MTASLAWASDNQKTNHQNGVALAGYDAVAYFQQAKAVPGNVDINSEWNGVSWQFSSQENKQLFIKNPQKFAPQYGGFCAYAASKGALANVDPTAWTIHNERLYLNFSHQVKEIWSQEKDQNISKADQNWPALSTSN
ncbi:MAG: YHS domain-containing protein [Parasphingorhabdus sp.]|jgi:YHS domain-containing protein